MEIPIHKDRNGQLYVPVEARLRRVQTGVDTESDGFGEGLGGRWMLPQPDCCINRGMLL